MDCDRRTQRPVKPAPVLFYSAWPLGYHNVEAERKARAIAAAGHEVFYVTGIGTRNPRLRRPRKLIDRVVRKLHHRPASRQTHASVEAADGARDRLWLSLTRMTSKRALHRSPAVTACAALSTQAAAFQCAQHRFAQRRRAVGRVPVAEDMEFNYRLMRSGGVAGRRRSPPPPAGRAVQAARLFVGTVKGALRPGHPIQPLLLLLLLLLLHG